MKNTTVALLLVLLVACDGNPTVPSAPGNRLVSESQVNNVIMGPTSFLAANDSPQQWTAIPNGDHLARISDSDDATYISSTFALVRNDWFRMPVPPLNLGRLIQTQFNVRYSDVIISPGLGEPFLFHIEVYKSDKTTLVGSTTYEFTGSDFSAGDLPALVFATPATRGEMNSGLFVRFYQTSNGALSETRLRIARLSVQYGYNPPTRGNKFIPENVPGALAQFN